MKRKIIVVLLGILLAGVLLSTSSVIIEASIKPTITVKNVGNNSLKVSWEKRKNIVVI